MWWRQMAQLNLSAPERIFIVRCSFCDAGNFAVTGIARMGSDLSQENLWVQDLERNTSVRLTSLPGASHSPVWFPDGKHILFMASNQPNPGIYWIPSDGGGQPAQLASLRLAYPSSFAPDARTLA